ncbi:hypothetical protein TRFO_30202 [Tritrichomonas foetus]|uniref:FPL domain-containing protein n=1 Tax=Tritrichomonas foetus TaxID=1144522 RepID=A0A1J4JYT7_9EUKA|nr:hypothetical protein TRFO_30202 [Tritrichomonas foetus]|eukprot:OHT02662.1 hypothetical protein TRFO_30202 [Tritrichomonas foetus]
MEKCDSIRRNLFFEGISQEMNFYFFSFFFDNKVAEEKITQKYFFFFQKITNAHDDESCIIFFLDSLNLLVKTHPKTVINLFTQEIIDFICTFVNYQKTYLPLFQLLLYLIQSSPIFVVYLLDNHFYELLIQKIDQNSFSISFYRQTLLLISETISRYEVYISYFYELGLIQRISVMDQTLFIELTLKIYSVCLLSNENQANLDVLSLILNYLRFHRENIIIDVLTCIKKCLIKYKENSLIWKLLIFNDQIINLFSINNPKIISHVIDLYSLICNFGDQPISEIFENNDISERIFNPIFLENEITSKSFFVFLNSLCRNSSSHNNIFNVYSLFKKLNMQNQMSLYNFASQTEISKSILILLSKLNHHQIIEFSSNLSELLHNIVSILILDSDSKQSLVISLENIRIILSATSNNNSQVIEDIINEYELFEDT